jgi:hypothetical protein
MKNSIDEAPRQLKTTPILELSSEQLSNVVGGANVTPPNGVGPQRRGLGPCSPDNPNGLI